MAKKPAKTPKQPAIEGEPAPSIVSGSPVQADVRSQAGRTTLAASYGGKNGRAFVAWLQGREIPDLGKFHPALRAPVSTWKPLYQQFMAQPIGGRR